MSTLAAFPDSTKLKESLMKDEQVLWKGRPAPFPLVTHANKSRMIVRWVVCAAIFVALTLIYLLMENANNSFHFNPIVEVIFLLVCAYAAFLPALDRNKILKKCKYYVTDSRVIVTVGDNDAFALSRKGLKVLRVPGEGGCVTLLFGSHTALPEKKQRVGAFVPGKDDNGELITGISFYNIPEDDDVKAFFPV